MSAGRDIADLKYLLGCKTVLRMVRLPEEGRVLAACAVGFDDLEPEIVAYRQTDRRWVAAVHRGSSSVIKASYRALRALGWTYTAGDRAVFDAPVWVSP